MPSFSISLVEAEAAADHADRADDRGGVANDLIGRAGDHVAAGRADIFDEGDDRELALGGKLANAPEDQVRLHRRTAGRVDRQRHRARMPHRESPLQHAGDTAEREAGTQWHDRADHARQPHHRHDRNVAAQLCWQYRPQQLDGLIDPGGIGFCHGPFCRPFAVAHNQLSAARAAITAAMWRKTLAAKGSRINLRWPAEARQHRAGSRWPPESGGLAHRSRSTAAAAATARGCA